MTSQQINYDTCPEHVRDSLRLFIESGCKPGGFLSAVLSNDLMASLDRADNTSLAVLFAIVSWLHNEVPTACYGSPQRVRSWRGLQNMGVTSAN